MRRGRRLRAGPSRTHYAADRLFLCRRSGGDGYRTRLHLGGARGCARDWRSTWCAPTRRTRPRSACDSLMAEDGPARLLVFAGDEGAAAAVALMSAEYHMPVLKLTSDTRSFARFSDSLYEFLPSMELQSQRLAEYAAKDLKLPTAVTLTPEDARGRALGDGFRQRPRKPQRPNLLAQRFYHPRSVRYPARRGGCCFPIRAARARRHRAERGAAARTSGRRCSAIRSRARCCLPRAARDSATAAAPAAGQGSFLLRDRARKGRSLRAATSVAARGHAAVRQQQLDGFRGALAPAVGDRRHVHQRAAAAAHRRSRRVLGCLSSRQHNRDATDWERLGLDAGPVCQPGHGGPDRARGSDVRGGSAETPFTGRAVIVEYAGGRENRAVRVVRFENRELRLVR